MNREPPAALATGLLYKACENSGSYTTWIMEKKMETTGIIIGVIQGLYTGYIGVVRLY